MANIRETGPPSAVTIALGSAIISGVFGYYLGQARSIGLFGTSSTAQVGQQSDDKSDISDADAGSGDDDDDDDDVQDLGELKTFPGNNEECKLVLVVRTDLGMGKGMWREAVCDCSIGSAYPYSYLSAVFAHTSSTGCPH